MKTPQLFTVFHRLKIIFTLYVMAYVYVGVGVYIYVCGCACVCECVRARG